MSYPIHSSIAGRFGGLHIKGDARNFSKSSTEYFPDIVRGFESGTVVA